MAGNKNQTLLLRAFVPLCLCVEIATLGCRRDVEPSPAAAAGPTTPKTPAKKSPPKSFQPPPAVQINPAQNTSPPAAPLPEKNLSDLAARAAAEEFRLPEIDEARTAAAGIRKLAGKHLILYTDLPAAPDIDELPSVFDQAVPQWSDYFAAERDKTAGWK